MALNKGLVEATTKEMANPKGDYSQEAKRLRDEAEKMVSDAKIVVASLDAQAQTLIANIAGLDDSFNKEYASRLQSLEDKAAKLMAQIAANERRTRELDRREIEIKETHDDFIMKQNEIISKVSAIKASNESILLDISQVRREVLAREKEAEVLEQQLHKEVELLQARERAIRDVEAGLDKRERAIASKEDETSSLHASARKILDGAERLHDENIEERKRLEESIVREEALIEEKRSILRKILDEKAANNALVEEQRSNLKVIQEVSESHISEMIALKALESSLNAKDRELKDRLKNIQTLEKNIKL
jgi:chromosome segregation ATPase